MPLDLDPKSCQPGFGPEIPACFASLEEAQNSFYYHQNRSIKVAHELDHHLLTDPGSPLVEGAVRQHQSQGRDAYRDISQKWTSAFDAFLLKAGGKMDSRALQGAAVLRINQRITYLHIEYHGQERFESSHCWDSLRLECEEIVDLATLVVKSHKDKSRDSSERPMFFMDMNIVHPLFSIAHRCRDPIIRRRAIALLYSAPRQEGLWHSVLTARAAEKIMETEEAGLGEVKSSADVPEEKRITEIDVGFDLQARKGYLKCGRRLLTGQNVFVAEPIMEVFRETIEY